ncbi:MAG: DUF5666 domain-containing protein [Thermoanaerobaculia bacterium]
MIRRVTTALALVLAVTTLGAGASEPGRRRPVTNPQTTVEGVIAAMSAEGFRVQTGTGMVNVTLTSGTQLMQVGATAMTPALGDYTIVEGLAARDGSVSAKSVALFNVPSSVATGETVRIDGRVATVTPELSELKLETPGGVLLSVATNETTLIRRDGTAIALKDIEVGSIARVVGKTTGERTLLALQIDIRTKELPRRDMIVGQVAEIRAADRTLLINPHRDGPGTAVLETVRADERTEIYRRGERIRFDDIALGDFVMAQGTFDASRVLLATRIDIADLPAPAPKIAGRVLEVSAATRQLTVAVERGWMHDAPTGPVTVVVTDTTKIYRDREQVRFDAIKAGDFIVVAGTWRDDKALVADTIHLASRPDFPPMPAILGEIVTIEPATKTLFVRVRAMRPLESSTGGTVKVLVGDDTKIFRNGQPIGFGDLKTGNAVIVVGELRDDKAILAKRIDAIVAPERPQQIFGFVSRVGPGSIEIIVPQAIPTFAPVYATLLVDEATEIVRKGVRIRLAEVKVNEMLFASGEWKSDNTMLARKIELRDGAPPPMTFGVRGAITAIDTLTLRLSASDGPWSVTATKMTFVFRPGGAPSGFASLKVGEVVDVSGMPHGDHSLIAMKIEVLP